MLALFLKSAVVVSFALPAFCQVLPRWFPPCFDASRPDPTLPPLAGKLTAGACWLSTKRMVHVSRDAGTHLVPGNGKPLRFCQEWRWSTCAHPRSALLAAFFPPPLQVLPVVVPPSSAMLVLCRWDQQRTADQLRSFPTQTDPAWEDETKGGWTADSLLLQGRTPGSGGHHSTEGRCQQASCFWSLLSV
jgi:hypothetical protein